MKYRSTLLAVALLAACGSKKSQDPPAPAKGSGSAQPAAAVDAAPAQPPPAVDAAAPTAAAPPTGDDLLALASGVVILDGPDGLEPTAREFAMLDENPATGWVQEEAKTSTKPVVLELPTRVTIEQLVLDEAKCDLDSRLDRPIIVEISDQSATDGFHEIARLRTTKLEDNQTFPVKAPATGRWVRITAKPHDKPDAGSTEVQVMELRAYGKRLGTPAPIDVTGSYETDYGEFELTQTGATITGCSPKFPQPILGGVEGRVAKFNWQQDESSHGTVTMVVGDKGRVWAGYFNVAVENPNIQPMWPKKVADKPKPCPGDKQDPIAAELAKTGRVRLYGINFDLDSDKLRDDSKPTLDKVVALLKADGKLALVVEGHTDASGGDEHNKKLSEARAASVKAALVAAGIDGARLTTKGFGASQPVAPNTSALGRAANRRVELAKP